MSLTKELLNLTKQIKISEDSQQKLEYGRFTNRIDAVEESLERRILPFLKEDSVLERMVRDLGGDVALVSDALATAKKLQDVLNDIKMSVGLAYQNEN